MPSPDDDPIGTCPDYEPILSELAGTARGRAFLAEHVRRHRAADTRNLLDALGRIEGAVRDRWTPGDIERLRLDLADMAGAIRRTKAEIEELAPGPAPARSALDDASEVLDGIVRTTDAATSAILDATEQVQETAWTMRESGFDPALCDLLDARATEIYGACEFQDLTAQRLKRVVRIVRFLDERIGIMSRVWGAPALAGGLSGPAPAPDLTQQDIDFVIVQEGAERS